MYTIIEGVKIAEVGQGRALAYIQAQVNHKFNSDRI